MENMKIFIGLCLFCQVFGKMQEMSWKMDANFMSYPPAAGNAYKHTMLQFGRNPQNGVFVSFGRYETTEHLGTHMDAPIHFSENGRRIDEIPLEDLNGPLVQININNKAHGMIDAEVTIEDLMAWETKHGRIPARSFILMHSGWDEYWGDNEKFLGTTEAGQPLHFPGFNKTAVDWLLENRNILGLGTDTLSCDSGAGGFAVHTTILPAGKVCIENLRNVGKVPECGARFMMFPIMLMNGTAAQGRALAEWFPKLGYQTSCNGALKETMSNYEASNSVTFVPSCLCIIVSMTLQQLSLK